MFLLPLLSLTTPCDVPPRCLRSWSFSCLCSGLLYIFFSWLAGWCLSLYFFVGERVLLCSPGWSSYPASQVLECQACASILGSFSEGHSEREKINNNASKRNKISFVCVCMWMYVCICMVCVRALMRAHIPVLEHHDVAVKDRRQASWGLFLVEAGSLSLASWSTLL